MEGCGRAVEHAGPGAASDACRKETVFNGFFHGNDCTFLLRKAPHARQRRQRLRTWEATEFKFSSKGERDNGRGPAAHKLARTAPRRSATSKHAEVTPRMLGQCGHVVVPGRHRRTWQPHNNRLCIKIWRPAARDAAPAACGRGPPVPSRRNKPARQRQDALQRAAPVARGRPGRPVQDRGGGGGWGRCVQGAGAGAGAGPVGVAGPRRCCRGPSPRTTTPPPAARGPMTRRFARGSEVRGFLARRALSPRLFNSLTFPTLAPTLSPLQPCFPRSPLRLARINLTQDLRCCAAAKQTPVPRGFASQ